MCRSQLFTISHFYPQNVKDCSDLHQGILAELVGVEIGQEIVPKLRDQHDIVGHTDHARK